MRDIVPLSSDDPRGTVLGIAALPMAMGGMIGGVLISLLVVGHWRRAAAILAYSVVAGLLLTLILDPWFGALQGNFAVEWLAIGLAMMATAALIVGLHGLIGPPGIAIGAVVTMFVGNPLSSASAPPEFLPWDWGTIGQCFVPGAGAALLRRISYFPDASTARYWWALILWAVVGGALLLFGQFRDQQVLRLALGTEPDRAPEPRGHRVREARPADDEQYRQAAPGEDRDREASYRDESRPATAPLPVAPARHVASEEAGLRGVMLADVFQPWTPAQGEAGALWPVLAAVAEGTFLITPHADVLEFVRRKADDHDRWLRGMQRYQRHLREAAQR